MSLSARWVPGGAGQCRTGRACWERATARVRETLARGPSPAPPARAGLLVIGFGRMNGSVKSTGEVRSRACVSNYVLW